MRSIKRTDESQQRLKSLLGWSQVVEKLFRPLHQAGIPATRAPRWKHVGVSSRRSLVVKSPKVRRQLHNGSHH